MENEQELKLMKARIALYHWMEGREYYKACEAMNFAEPYHNGKRSGGDPEFSHQIWIANYITTLPLSKKNMEDALILAFLHDLCEDKNVPYEEIQKRFGKRIKKYVEAISKEYHLTGEKKTPEEYYQGLIKHAIVVIVKGADRYHNLTTMYGPFSRTKQEKYIKESIELHLPLLKEARKTFPAYRLCFEAIKQAILGRITTVKERHDETDKIRKEFENKEQEIKTFSP